MALDKQRIISFHNSSPKTLLYIDQDGKVFFGEGVVPDQAAAAFWEAVGRLNPIELGKKLSGLVEQLKLFHCESEDGHCLECVGLEWPCRTIREVEYWMEFKK